MTLGEFFGRRLTAEEPPEVGDAAGDQVGLAGDVHGDDVVGSAGVQDLRGNHIKISAVNQDLVIDRHRHKDTGYGCTSLDSGADQALFDDNFFHAAQVGRGHQHLLVELDEVLITDKLFKELTAAFALE